MSEKAAITLTINGRDHAITAEARRTLADYLPPTAHEIPPIELHHIETPSPNSITMAKGLGEGGCIGAPAAVINAINDALSPFGVEIDEMPATPQRIRAALRAKEKAA